MHRIVFDGIPWYNGNVNKKGRRLSAKRIAGLRVKLTKELQVQFYTTKELRQAASAVHGFGYIVKAQHVGGRGDVLTLIPEESAERRTETTYFLATTDAGCFVAKPAPAWGEYDEETMQRFSRVLRDRAPVQAWTRRCATLFKEEVR